MINKDENVSSEGKTHLKWSKKMKKKIIAIYQKIETIDITPFFDGFSEEKHIIVLFEMIEKCRFARTNVTFDKYRKWCFTRWWS